MIFFHGAGIKDRFDGMRSTAPRMMAYVSALSLMWITLFYVLLGDRVEADAAAVEGLVELAVAPSMSTTWIASW